MKKNLLALSLLLSICGHSQTSVSGSILSNTTWTAAASPYIVTGNIIVFSGVHLTIDPGVVVKFNSGTGMEVRGTLSAIGTAADSIELTSTVSPAAISSWTGIKATGTTSPTGVGNQITMDYVKGSGAGTFVDLDLAYHGPYIFKHCFFSFNDKVNNNGGDPVTVFENCKFVSNNNAINYCQFDSRVSNCTFMNNVNGLNGIAHVDTCTFTGNTGIALSPYGSTIGCTVTHNNTGVSCLFNSVNNTFMNNIVTDNTDGVIIQSYFNGSIFFTGNTICNNSAYNIQLLTSNNADLSGNCWCSQDSATVRSKIYDGYINNAYGIVRFTPFGTSCASVGTGIETNMAVNSASVAVFPNPFTDLLTVSISSAETITAELILYDVTGRKVIQQKFSTSVSIDTAPLDKGIYLYTVRNAKGVFRNGKIIKE